MSFETQKPLSEYKRCLMHWGTYLPHVDAAKEDEVFFDFGTKTVYQRRDGKWEKLTKE